MTHSGHTPFISDEDVLDDDDIILLTDEILPEIEDDDDIILLTDEILPEIEDDDIIELNEIAALSGTQPDMALTELADEKTDDTAGFFDLSDVLEESDLKTEQLLDFSESETAPLALDFDRVSDPLLSEPKLPDEENVLPDVFDSSDTDVLLDLAEEAEELDTETDLFLSQEPAATAIEDDIDESLNLAAEPVPIAPLFITEINKPQETEGQMDDLQKLIHEVVHDSQIPSQDLPGMQPALSKSSEKDAAGHEDLLTSLPREQIDAALERVIKNLFADRIEHILDEVVTRTVTQELAALKTNFLHYLSSGKSTD